MCGCKNGSRQARAEAAAARAAQMEQTAAMEKVPLGLKETVRLPVRIAGVVGESGEKDLIVIDKDDRRLIAGAAVVRGRDGLVSAYIRENVIAKHPGVIVEEVRAPEPV